jgi:putative ABC transport system permease protein
VRVFSGLALRKVLLMGQFTLSLVLLIALTVMVLQVRHAVSMDYGMNWQRTAVVGLHGQDPVRVANRFAQESNVGVVAAMSHEPLTWQDRAEDVRVNRSDSRVAVRNYAVDANFLDLFGLKLAAGINFHKDLRRSNEDLVLVNEQFVKRFRLGTPEEAVGRSLVVGDSVRVSIAGVLKDFLFKPATYELEPLILQYKPKDWNVLVVKLGGEDARGTLANFEGIWRKIDPYHPFDGRLYGDIITDVYRMYTDMGVLVGFLAVLALTITFLGLFGIVAFQVERRIKEIGIRKVLGATLASLVLLLARRELFLLLISTLLAVPVGLLLSSLFLEDFAQRIGLGAMSVLPGLIFMYACALLTIGGQALKAAYANPVEALRYE